MRRFLIFVPVFFVLVLFAACGSDEGAVQMDSDEEWVRSEPVNVKALDTDKDGFVYQDPMDWNVIADHEGNCPKCGMKLEKVTIEEAEQNLMDHGFEVKKNG